MKFFLGVITMLLIIPLYGQSIKGVVLDENASPIENANIFNKESGQHAHTNATGFFSIPKTKVGDSLYFSSLGYETLLYVLSEGEIQL